MRKRKNILKAITGVASAMLFILSAFTGQAEERVEFGDIVVTAPMMSDPLTVETDPKAPRQPVPAPDGASYLKNIPGFAVSRKGGTDGDPALRGMGGSRLNILLDGSSILGGCNNRMDPPTAYVYPESYDKIIVLKGPQSVIYGANVAGAVLFERDTKRFEEPGVRGIGSLLYGSFGRNDQMLDVTAGTQTGFIRAIGTRSHSDDYEDGDGGEVHSEYTRWSATGIAGWTPTENTKIEFSYDKSDGEAAYADRTMDGAEFDRDGYGVKIASRNLSDLFESVEIKAYHNYIDHVMDNFSFRNTTAGSRSVMNPDRETKGARAEAKLDLGEAAAATVGADYQTNEHRSRMDKDNMDGVIALGARQDQASFETRGYFGELEYYIAEKDRMVIGARLDESEAEAKALWTMMDTDGYGGATPGTSDDDSNTSGFLRWEHDLTPNRTTTYVGLGRAERSPDYWEREKDFTIDREKNTQFDIGLKYGAERLKVNVALFYSDITDYILIANSGADAKNIDATIYGGEADMAWSFADSMTFNATLSYVHGDNETDDTDLAQMPPLEGTIGINYDNKTISGGILYRMVAKQDRIDVGSGTIYGTDIGETDGFEVLSINGGYRLTKDIHFTAGVDNLLDKTYSEHLAKGSADLGTVIGRVNEPGRTYWVKATGKF
ncbi:MAG: TonB-dependent copper receptor [bacterium]|nr:TonB-dependent copper receptor [bacterium]